MGRFGRHSGEVGRARELVRSRLHEWGLAADVAAMQLAVSELVTNALMHGEGRIEVRFGSDGRQIWLDVTDEGQAAEAPRPVSRSERGDRPGGVGLRVVARLADRWGAASDGQGTRVWMVRRAAARLA